MHIENVIFLILSKNAYTKFSEVPVTNWVKLTFVAMNLKKFANWKWKDTHFPYISCIISIICPKYVLNPCLA